MPQKSSSKPKPVPMTWVKAMPILTVCVLFDALRFMCTAIIFFAPAFAGLACAIAADSAAVGGACALGAGAVALVGAKVVIPFGLLMGMVVGLVGWLTVFVLQLMNNVGIFKENYAFLIRMLVAFILSETPFLNALPALTTVNAYMFHVQIKKGRKELKKWEEEQAAASLEEKSTARTEAERVRQQQVAANEDQYQREQEAAQAIDMDDALRVGEERTLQSIPEKERLAA